MVLLVTFYSRILCLIFITFFYVCDASENLFKIWLVITAAAADRNFLQGLGLSNRHFTNRLIFHDVKFPQLARIRCSVDVTALHRVHHNRSIILLLNTFQMNRRHVRIVCASIISTHFHVSTQHYVCSRKTFHSEQHAEYVHARAIRLASLVTPVLFVNWLVLASIPGRCGSFLFASALRPTVGSTAVRPEHVAEIYRVRHKSVNRCTFCRWSYFR
jgi:hypothetical protein